MDHAHTLAPGRPRSGGMPARDELRRNLRQIRRRGFHQQYINHDDDHQAAHDHKPTALGWLPRQVVDRGDAATTHDDRAQDRRRAGHLSIPFR